MKHLDEIFDEYIDSDEAEATFNDYFSILRKVYKAGYKAGKESQSNSEGQIVKLELIENRKLSSV